MFNPAAGLHVYVPPAPAPFAVIPIVSPPHIAGDIPVMPMVTVGFGFTLTVTVCVPVHPLDVVPVTVYVIVDVALLVTVAPVVALKPVDGLHEYVPPAPAPLAVSDTEPPVQYVVGPPGVIVIVGSGFTVTVTFAESLQPPLEPTTVYVVVDTIVTNGLGQVVQLKPVAGFQL